MTKEEAVRILKVLLLKIEPPTDTQLGWLETWVTKEDIQGLHMAIKALEPCEDCVSREKVWYMITGGKYSDENDEQFIDRLVNELAELPSVTPQEPKWIPVSEGLPKVADCYAVTRKSEDDLTVKACYFDKKNWHDDNWINHERNYLTDIIAWMPLPKPYKPQESE